MRRGSNGGETLKADLADLEHERYGHLFTDASLPAEYDKASAELAGARALAFLERVGGGS